MNREEKTTWFPYGNGQQSRWKKLLPIPALVSES